MNRKIVILIIIAVIALGFVLGVLFPKNWACTKKGCYCNGDAEVPCNSCSRLDYIFLSGIFNVAKSCSGQEVIVCESNQAAEERIDIKSCRYVASLFGISLN